MFAKITSSRGGGRGSARAACLLALAIHCMTAAPAAAGTTARRPGFLPSLRFYGAAAQIKQALPPPGSSARYTYPRSTLRDHLVGLGLLVTVASAAASGIAAGQGDGEVARRLLGVSALTAVITAPQERRRQEALAPALVSALDGARLEYMIQHSEGTRVLFRRLVTQYRRTGVKAPEAKAMEQLLTSSPQHRKADAEALGFPPVDTERESFLLRLSYVASPARTR
jgi:hypothetical protein